jgi:HD-like signal output (HDOD) protein
VARHKILVPLDANPARVRQAIWRLEELPALSPAVHRALALCSDPLCSHRDLERVISADQSLVAQLLKVANSTYYAFEGGVTTVSRAITVIGHEKLQSLLLRMMIAGAFKRLAARRPEAKRLLAVSAAAAAACQALGEFVDGQDPETLLVAGLLHNVGELVLVCEFSGDYRTACRLAQSMSPEAAQRAVFGADSHEIGRWLLDAWGLPLLLAESAEHWNDPLRVRLENCPPEFVCVVHAGARLGQCWVRQANWQETMNWISPAALRRIALSEEALLSVSETLAERSGQVQVLLE